MGLPRVTYIPGEEPLSCQPANIAYQPCTFIIIQTWESCPYWEQGGVFCPDHDPAHCTALMLELIDRFCERNQLLSCNFLYVDPSWRVHAEAAGCRAWLHQQSLWSNPGYSSFEDYLASFNANQRRNIRRERKAVQKAGLTVTPIAAEAITPELLERMHGT